MREFKDRMVPAFDPSEFALKIVPGADPMLICYTEGVEVAGRLLLKGLGCEAIIKALEARGVAQDPTRPPTMNHHAYQLGEAKKVRDQNDWTAKKKIRDDEATMGLKKSVDETSIEYMRRVRETRKARQVDECDQSLEGMQEACEVFSLPLFSVIFNRKMQKLPLFP